MRESGFEPGDPTQHRFGSYALANFPDARDISLDEYVTDLRRGGPAGVAAAISTVSERGRQVLRAYGERAATRAVRDQDRRLLELGLIAVVVGGLDQNALEALMRMPLLEDAAVRLELDPADVFEAASGVVGHPGSVNLMVWLSRAPEDRTPECMGFRATGSGATFRYRWAA